jgi:hypothetical protein
MGGIIITNFTVKVLSIGYNCIKVIEKSSSKVIYIQKFPPTNGTSSVPQMTIGNTSSIDQDTISKQDLVSFWLGEEKYQSNSKWKGGRWGIQNLPTIDPTWCDDVFIGDEIVIKFIKSGIIPFAKRKRKPFDPNDIILEGTEQCAWSCNLILGEITYSGYITDEPIGQEAIDVLLITENDSKIRYIKSLRRGTNRNTVDMPQSYMSAEHCEPVAGKPKLKDDILKTVTEEQCIDASDFANSYLIHLKTFDTTDRDPRYSKFNYNGQDFGFDRKSRTNLYMLYLKFTGNKKPKKVKHDDNIEVQYTFWEKLDDAIARPQDQWLIPENATYPQIAKTYLDNIFINLSQEELDTLKVSLIKTA